MWKLKWTQNFPHFEQCYDSVCFQTMGSVGLVFTITSTFLFKAEITAFREGRDQNRNDRIFMQVQDGSVRKRMFVYQQSVFSSKHKVKNDGKRTNRSNRKTSLNSLYIHLNVKHNKKNFKEVLENKAISSQIFYRIIILYCQHFFWISFLTVQILDIMEITILC